MSRKQMTAEEKADFKAKMAIAKAARKKAAELASESTVVVERAKPASKPKPAKPAAPPKPATVDSVVDDGDWLL